MTAMSPSVRDSNPGNDVRDQTSCDQARAAAIADIQGAINEGIESGVSTRTPADILADARQRTAARR